MMAAMTREALYIYGIHPVEEALMHAPKAVTQVFLGPQHDNTPLASLIARRKIPVTTLTLDRIPRELVDAVHQGVVATIDRSQLMHEYREWIGNTEITPGTSVVILGEVQDPHNVGAIIRSAVAFGVAAILLPEHNQAPLTGVVIKASAGMAFRIPLISIGNVNQTINDLKRRGFWVYGLASGAPNTISEEKFDTPAAFIVGNEGRGLREKTEEHCDILLAIPMDPRCESLNASISTAIVLHRWYSQHHSKRVLE
jgi:23S rRNA (guanosine2251-2'-O)-methyltransferase